MSRNIGQLAFPMLVAAGFWRKRFSLGLAFALGWLARTLWNFARYMADAPEQVLPRVRGGEHDWTENLWRWGALDADTWLAGWTGARSWAALLGAGYWLGRRRRSEEA